MIPRGFAAANGNNVKIRENLAAPKNSASTFYGMHQTKQFAFMCSS